MYHSNVSRVEGRLKNFDVMKRHFKAYVNDFDNVKELRMRLMETENAAEVREILEGFFKVMKKG